jgi:type IV secretory pathway TraG/TraD family ATPase VirD4
MYAMTHSAKAAYLLVLIPMMVALIRQRAPVRKFLEAFPCALIMVLFCTAVLALISPLLGYLGAPNGGLIQWVLDAGLLVLMGYSSGNALMTAPTDSIYRRGAIVSAGKRKPTPRGSDALRPVTVAGLPVASNDEAKHFKLIGTTGTGKSTAISEILSAALARGDRAVIADPDGGYLRHFCNAARGDVILNPFEPGSVKWNLLGEIATEYDVDQLARSLIPDSGGQDRIWSGYARTFFTAVVQKSLEADVKDDGEIYRLVRKAPVSELKLMLEDSAAAPFLEDGNERMFGSLRSVASSALEALRYTTKQNAAPFSVRQWIRHGAAVQNGGKGGVLFIPYQAGEIAALRSVISAWMRIAIFEAMGQGEADQRLWFVIDELDALGEIDGLKDALARLRKFGGRCVLGFQSISQVSSTYGKGTADTIVENCGNSLILRCSASEQGGTSQFASRLIGQREVTHLTRSKTHQPRAWGASTTVSEHRAIEPAIMASEIERLPDLEGYLKFASIPDWTRVTLSHMSYPVMREKQPRTVEPSREAPPVVVSEPTEGGRAPATRAEQKRSPSPILKSTRKSMAENAQSSESN